jgi:hypothetical protein
VSLHFKKNKEDFICKNCGTHIHGDGYTNHCKKCLYSTHADNYPGDRGSKCKGLMRPIRTEKDHGEYTITHKCIKCGTEKKNKMQKGDDFEALLSI